MLAHAAVGRLAVVEHRRRVVEGVTGTGMDLERDIGLSSHRRLDLVDGVHRDEGVGVAEVVQARRVDVRGASGCSCGQCRSVVAHQRVHVLLGGHVERQPTTEAEADRADVAGHLDHAASVPDGGDPVGDRSVPVDPLHQTPFPAAAGPRRPRRPRRRRAASRSPAPARRNPDAARSAHRTADVAARPRRSPGTPPRPHRCRPVGNHSWVGIEPSSVAISIRRSGSNSVSDEPITHARDPSLR